METHTSGPKPRLHLFGFLDETGLLHSPTTDQLFALGLLTVQNPRDLHRNIINFKNHKNFRKEFKFAELSRQNLPVYKGLIDIFFQHSNQRFHVAVYDKRKLNFANHNKAYNEYCGDLIGESLNSGSTKVSEYITVLADDVSTPKDDKFEVEVREMIRRRARRNALFGMCRLESHAVAELQLCDVMLGAVNYSYKIRLGLLPAISGYKHELVRHIQRHLGVTHLSDAVDRRQRRNIRFKILEHL